MDTCRTRSLSCPAQNQPAGPTVEQLFGYASEQITLAAGELWPDERFRLGEHVPSVTGYVRRVEANGRMLFAKYSYLGSSLVSILRGKCGDWNQVRAAQQLYVEARGSLLEREAGQLRLMSRLGRPRVHRAVALRRGVLFTEAVSGISLTRLISAEPHRVYELLGRTWAEVRMLHRREVAPACFLPLTIQERSITGTFCRKFTGIGGNAYLDQLIANRDERWAVLPDVVARLGRIRATMPVAAVPVLVYGDLKPEHVVFEHRGIASVSPVFIDPGMSRAPATVDAARLVSRIILLLIGFRPLGIEVIAEGLAGFVDDLVRALPARARRAWLCNLQLLWLMDMVNILTTYLSAPRDLPLPRDALTDGVEELCSPYQRSWLGLPMSFTGGHVRACLPTLNADETRHLDAADIKLNVAYAALVEQLQISES